MLDISIFFSSTILRTEGDKYCLLLGGIYFASFISLEFSSTNVSRIKASLEFSSASSLKTTKGSSSFGLIFLFFFFKIKGKLFPWKVYHLIQKLLFDFVPSSRAF